MGLGSVLRTALTGISAAESSLGVVANNMANSQTKGFKASRAEYAAQQPQTHGQGSSPSANNGGTNPNQTGNGVRHAGSSTDFTQGTVTTSGRKLDLAIQGDGLFILEGDSGERNYSRDGQFSLNADKELVASGGRRVLGFAANDKFQIQSQTLSSLRIPLGKQIAGENGEVVTMNDFSITSDGRIRGRFSDGKSRDMGQIGVARFANPSGLKHEAGNVYSATPSSGLAIEGAAGDGNNANTSLMAGALEESNTDIGQGLIDLMQASNQFRAGMVVMATTEEMLDASFGSLLGLPRIS